MDSLPNQLTPNGYLDLLYKGYELLSLFLNPDCKPKQITSKQMTKHKRTDVS